LASLIAGISIIVHIIKKDHFDMMVKSRLIANEYRIHPVIPKELLEEFGFAIITGVHKESILSQIPPKHEEMRFPKYVNFFSHKGHLFLHITRADIDLLLRDNRTYFDRFVAPVVVLVLILLLLVVMYLLLRKALLPLRGLERDITLYGEGRLEGYPLSLRKDEISQVANAFYRSALRLKKLSDSRMLFIRNLFHELNTPVTKGKILTELIEGEKTKNILEAIFWRLAILLKELARIEQITSENYTLSKTNIHIANLIDEASDLLFLEQPLETNVKDEMIYADFASMSIVFKNLIDNGIKHGQDLQILYHPNKLSFLSKGERLEGSFKDYLQPFAQSNRNKKEGMGLGLYIVSEVLSLHQMDFGYIYEEGRNVFTISLVKEG